MEQLTRRIPGCHARSWFRGEGLPSRGNVGLPLKGWSYGVGRRDLSAAPSGVGVTIRGPVGHTVGIGHPLDCRAEPVAGWYQDKVKLGG